MKDGDIVRNKGVPVKVKTGYCHPIRYAELKNVHGYLYATPWPAGIRTSTSAE